MVYRVEDVAVGCDAFVVVEILERLFEEDDECRFSFRGVDAVGREDVGPFSPSLLRIQPRGGGDVLQ